VHPREYYTYYSILCTISKFPTIVPKRKGNIRQPRRNWNRGTWWNLNLLCNKPEWHEIARCLEIRLRIRTDAESLNFPQFLRLWSKFRYKCFEAFDGPIRRKNFTNWPIKKRNCNIALTILFCYTIRLWKYRWRKKVEGTRILISH